MPIHCRQSKPEHAVAAVALLNCLLQCSLSFSLKPICHRHRSLSPPLLPSPTSLCHFNSLSQGDNPQLVLLEIGNIIQSYPNVDLSNSATSLNINQPGKFDTEAISDAEMLFENICSYSDPKKESPFASFLLDIQENIINNVFHEGSHLIQFLLDCVVECIYMKLGHFCRSGYFTWLKLPSVLKGDWLVREVCQEIIEWKNSCGKRLDDLIQKEMNGSNLKWAECKVEAFGIRMEIQSDRVIFFRH